MASPQLQQALGMFKEMGAKMAEAKDINAMRAIMIEAQAPAGVTCTPVEAGAYPPNGALPMALTKIRLSCMSTVVDM